MRVKGEMAGWRFWCCQGLVLIFAVCCAQASGTGTGTVSGRVQDPTGAALEGVSITLSDQKTGHPVATTATSSTGAYAFDLVEAGKYELKAERTDFRPSVSSMVDLTAQRKVTVNLVLQPLQPPATRGGQEGSTQGQKRNTVGFYSSPSLKADEFAGSVDPGGYSAPANADTTTHLLEGAATLRKDSAAGLDAKPDKATEASDHSPDLSETELKSSVERNPQSVEAHHALGKLYLVNGRPEEAIPYLAEAYRLDPSERANAYDLSVAYLRTNNLSAARQLVQAMLERGDTADLHSLLAEVEERAGNFKEAIQEYQRAAEIAPSEHNAFNWGCELLLHRDIEAGLSVFESGVTRYPGSPEMRIGLGIALYLRGDYDDAVRSLVQATDLDPTDDRPYSFLAYASNASPKEAASATERLRRFAETHPQDARAVYYYALSLWKGSRGEERPAELDQVEALLKKAIALDAKFPEAYLRLGVLYASQEKYPQAIEQYERAIDLDAGLAEAHYKLGQALARTGSKERADLEFKVYERLHQQPAASNEKGPERVQQLINLVNEGKKSTP
jgi:tetratricopeptide (TPR) repeat protein